MSLIQATDLSRSYGAQDVFSDVTVRIANAARIALVGPNGIGKTTLLRLLTGDEQPDEGKIHRARNTKIGYLVQETSYSRSRQENLNQTLWDTCLTAFGILLQQEKKLFQLEAQMADANRGSALLERYGKLQAAFDAGGGYTYPHRIRKVLSGLGFSPGDHSRTLSEFSGGEQARAFFARLLLEEPDLLILDEPTNHLDIRAIEWLEDWINSWSGAVLIVSHDRYFLDRTVTTVWELSARGVENYRGNFTAYIHQREERREYQSAMYRAQQKYIEKEQDYIRKNIAGQNTKQAQGRQKRLMRKLHDHKIDQPFERKKVKIDFAPSTRSGNIILETHNLEIGLPDDSGPLFKVPDLVLLRGESVAIIGPNGAGKTTLLKTLINEVPPYSGQLHMGANLKLGYFAQTHEDLDPNRTLLEEVQSLDRRMGQNEARSILGRFLFFGDEVFKKIEMLSGGERGRLALAKLVLGGANLLILDEPTNHLDIPSQENLQAALEQFPETTLLVSHDRYLIDRLASQIWSIIPEEGIMETHRGSYSTYAAEKKRKAQPRKSIKIVSKNRAPKGAAPEKEISIEDLEQHIMEKEQALARVGERVVEAGKDVEHVKILGQEYALLEEDLRKAIETWERIVNRA